MVNISKSRIHTFERCQQLFKYQYIDKVELGETFEMGKGTIFHLWTEKLDKELKTLSDQHQIKNHLENLASTDEWEKYYINFLLELLEKSLTEKKDRWQEYFYPTHIEVTFKADIEGNTWRCIIDRVWKTFSDDFMLVELKTGIATLEDVRKELSIAKIIIDNVLNVDCKYFGIINPNLKITKTEKVKKISVTSAKKAVQKFIDIVNSGVFSKNTWGCGNCSYSELCYDYSFFKG